jgi:hypothetical protein
MARHHRKRIIISSSRTHSKATHRRVMRLSSNIMEHRSNHRNRGTTIVGIRDTIAKSLPALTCLNRLPHGVYCDTLLLFRCGRDWRVRR